MMQLGVTGGIGSGKSTVTRLLAQRGATVIDADAISRELTAIGGRAIALIADAFGPHLIRDDGSLDRDRMRALAFGDSNARKRLEAIVHPLVGQETRHRADLAAAQGCPCVVFDIPLLVESGHWRQRLDHILVVDCDPETQIRRVMERSQLGRAEVQKIMASQATRASRLAAADSVLFNDGVTIDALGSEVRQISSRFGLSSL